MTQTRRSLIEVNLLLERHTDHMQFLNGLTTPPIMQNIIVRHSLGRTRVKRSCYQFNNLRRMEDLMGYYYYYYFFYYYYVLKVEP